MPLTYMNITFFLPKFLSESMEFGLNLLAVQAPGTVGSMGSILYHFTK
jgi:hypothetical protein